MKHIFAFFSVVIFSSLNAQESFLKYYDFNTPYCEIYDIEIINKEIFGTGFGWDTTLIPPRQLFYVFNTDIKGSLIDHIFYHEEDTSSYSPIIIGPLYFQCLLPLGDSSFVVSYFNMNKGYLEIFRFDTNLNLLNKNKILANNSNTAVFPSKILLLDECIFLSGLESLSTGVYKSYLFKYSKDLELIWKKEIPNIERVRSFEYNKEKNEFSFSEYNAGDKYVTTDTLLNAKGIIPLYNMLLDVYHEHMRFTTDGDYLTASYNLNGTSDFTLNIVKRDSLANTLWKFGLGGVLGYKASVVNIIPSSDGAYFAYGQVGARTADTRDIYSSLDSIDIMMLSTVKFREDGRILWQRFDTLELGYYNISYAKSGGMVASDDGGIYVSGDVTCYDTIRVDGEIKRKTVYKHFLMKIDSSGCVEGLHCNVEPKTETILSVTPGITAADDRLHIYPNPGTGRITITRDEHIRSGLLTVYDARGVPLISRKVSPGSEEIQLDLTGRSPGRYYVTVRQEDGKIATGSFILVR